MPTGDYELQRTDSVCPTPEARLLQYVEGNQIFKIKRLIADEGRGILSAVYGYPHYKTILQIACSNSGSSVKADTVKALIELGADLYSPNEHFENKQCLHFAAEKGDPKILEVVLDNILNDEVNSVSDGNNTALHCLVKNCERDEETQAKCAELLVSREGFDVNKTDSKNLPAIFYASKAGKKEVVKSILKNSRKQVDLDSSSFRGKTSRDLIEEKKLFDNLPPANDLNNYYNANDLKLLFSYLYESKPDEFLISSHLNSSIVNEDDGEFTLLQFASWKGFNQVVDKLIQLGADPSKVTAKKKETPLEIAASEGYHEVVKILLGKSTDISPSILLNALKQADIDSVDPKRNHLKCCELLLEYSFTDVNVVDNNNSLLHYAVRYGGSETVLALLRKGASLASKNRYGIMPIEDIDASTMEKHLNECLEANLEKSIENENFEVTFNYKTLMPPRKIRNNKVKDENNHPDDIEAASSFLKNELEDLAFETETVYFMSKSPELRHLLKHPVITSFLYMKWLRLSCFFYTNLAFYLTFCFSLLLYVFINYNVEEDAATTRINSLLLVLLSITFTVLFLREVFQILVSPKTYILNFENWIELVLIFFTAIILFQKDPPESVKRQVSALVILLAAFEVVLLIGQHPKMTTNIVMLRTVSYNFFKFFLWYAVLIVAFSLSFFILFKGGNADTEISEKNATTDAKGEQDFFVDPGVSLFKTIVMLTGEFDASDIDFQVYPITSHVVFALFIFMIAIILFNLLNGLAVSDTQMIKSNAELVGHIARIEHIRYIENMFLGNVLPHYLLKFIEDKCCCISIPIGKFTFLRPFSYRICLFPHYLKDWKLKVFPNRQGKIVLADDNVFMDDSVNPNCVNDCKYIYLDTKTTKRTRNLLREKKKELDQKKTEQENERKQKEILQLQIQRMEEIRNEQKRILEILNNFINQQSMSHSS